MTEHLARSATQHLGDRLGRFPTRQSMAKRHHTIIVIPHANARLRKWRVTNLQIGLLAGALVVLTFAAAFFLWSHFSTKINPVEIARLRTENERLRRTNQTFESSVKRLQLQITESEERTRQLAIVAGVDSLESGSAEAGVGGGGPVEEAEAKDLPVLESRAGALTGTLDAVEMKLEERVRWISSTPAIAPVRGILTSSFGYRSDPLTHGPGVHQRCCWSFPIAISRSSSAPAR